jgi:phosphoglucomutase
MRVDDNGAAIGGLKVVTAHDWFSPRPSGTEAVQALPKTLVAASN